MVFDTSKFDVFKQQHLKTCGLQSLVAQSSRYGGDWGLPSTKERRGSWSETDVTTHKNWTSTERGQRREHQYSGRRVTQTEVVSRPVKGNWRTSNCRHYERRILTEEVTEESGRKRIKRMTNEEKSKRKQKVTEGTENSYIPSLW